ncbi:MAG: hypothetical protein KJ595_09430, partial [Gammaproteobacteria bacterium]|nr:hypothetical protein [Gammaproteobacteria bacterium]
INGNFFVSNRSPEKRHTEQITLSCHYSYGDSCRIDITFKRPSWLPGARIRVGFLNFGDL